MTFTMKHEFTYIDTFKNHRRLTSEQLSTLHNLTQEEKEHLRYVIEGVVYHLYGGRVDMFFETERQVSDLEIAHITKKVNEVFSEKYPNKPRIVSMDEIGALNISEEGRKFVAQRRYLEQAAIFLSEERLEEETERCFNDNNYFPVEAYPEYTLDDIMGIKNSYKD